MEYFEKEKPMHRIDRRRDSCYSEENAWGGGCDMGWKNRLIMVLKGNVFATNGIIAPFLRTPRR
ncbi:hypothetical protein SRB521_03056 [Intestinimonas butyriciproducens]|nr:hypothetical protein SRB521_03056 [Intestinimonas butyriciproducens]